MDPHKSGCLAATRVKGGNDDVIRQDTALKSLASLIGTDFKV